MVFSKKGTDAIEQLIQYTIMNEVNYVHEELGHSEPADTILWEALVAKWEGFCNSKPPHIAFMELVNGVEVSPDGILINKEEYFGEEV
jgi:hypothetical protein